MHTNNYWKKNRANLSQLNPWVAAAPVVFQKTMETILQGIEEAICYIDDVLVTTKTQDEHLKLLATVLQHGVKIRKVKCQFLSLSVEFLGYRNDAHGRHPSKEKIEAIQNAPTPVMCLSCDPA